MRTRWPRFAQFVLPNLCSLCGNLSRSVLCTACDAICWNEPRLRCAVCAIPLTGARRRTDGPRYRCGACVDAPPAFDATLALGDYRAPLDLLARGLKFRARLALGAAFARRLAQEAEDALDPFGRPDVLVPVPLSRERLIERGYNQALEIARPLARAATPRSCAASSTRRRNRGSTATRAAATWNARLH